MRFLLVQPGLVGMRAVMTTVGLVLALGFAGSAAAQQQPGITARDADDATYQGIYDDPITLMAGYWQGKPYEPGGFARPTVTLIEPLFRLGDLNGDGVQDAVVGLEETGGGTGHFLYLAVLERRGAELVNVASRWIEDRVPVRSLVIDQGRIVLRSLQEGPGDAACCKTMKVRQVFALKGGELAELSREELGQASTRDLEGTRWVLASLEDGATALASPTVTLTVEGGRIFGWAGCNRYQGTLANPERTDLKVDDLMTTRMRCDPLVLGQEDAYLARLALVVGFSYDAGRLSLVYGNDSLVGRLTYRDGGGRPAGLR